MPESRKKSFESLLPSLLLSCVNPPSKYKRFNFRLSANELLWLYQLAEESDSSAGRLIRQWIRREWSLRHGKQS